MSPISPPFKGLSRNTSTVPIVHYSGMSSTRVCRITAVATIFVLLSLFFLFCVSSRFQSAFSSLRLSPAFWRRPARAAHSQNTTADQTPKSQPQSCHLANSSFDSLTDILTNLPTALQDYAAWHKQQRACLLDARCKQKPKLLVFRCPPHGYCLGLGDRMRGVMFTLFYAILTRRLYIIAWPDDPYPLKVALSPASLDWTPPPGFSLNRKWPYLQITYCDNSTVCNWREPTVERSANIDLNGTGINLYTDDLKLRFGHHNVISVSLKLARRHSDRKLGIKDMFYGFDDTEEDFGTMVKEVYRMLFKPSEEVVRKMKSLGIRDDEAYIGVHMRTGVDVNEDYEERFDYINSHLELIVENMLDCLEIADGKNATRLVFLAADSTKAKKLFVKMAKERGMDVKLFEKETIHFLKVNFQEEHPFDDMCDRYLTVFADLYMLSRSQTLVSTRSHFSEFAHALSDKVNQTHICYIPERKQSLNEFCKVSKYVIC